MSERLNRAIHDTATDYGVEKMARVMGRRPQVFRNKITQTQENHHLTVEEMVAMMEIAGDLRILKALNDEFGQVMTPKDKKSPVGLIKALLHAATVRGELDKAIEEALEDNLISENEKIKIVRIRDRLRLANDDVEAAAIAQAETDKQNAMHLVGG